MNAHTYTYTWPGNSALKFIWYEIDAYNYSSTHLTTRISGYFQYPYIAQFTASFLIIIGNNPFMDNYFTLNYL